MFNPSEWRGGGKGGGGVGGVFCRQKRGGGMQDISVSVKLCWVQKEYSKQIICFQSSTT